MSKLKAKDWIVRSNHSNERENEIGWAITRLLSRVGPPLAALAIIYFLRGVMWWGK